MPVQQGKSSIIAKYGDRLRKAHEDHAADETEYGFGDLPAGIEGGIAQLVECKFDMFKQGDQKGEFFFYAAGVVVSPVEFGGVRVAGLRTSVTEALCDTPNRTRKTVEDHIGFIYNELRKLGVDTKELQFEDLEATVEAIKESQPFFRFRTWKGSKATTGPYKDREPRTQHQWGGLCDPPEGLEDGAGVEDGGTPEAEANGQATEPPRKAPAGGKVAAPAPGPKGKKPPPPVEEPEQFDEFGDIDSLVTKAEEGETEAQNALIEFATKAGATQSQIDGAKNWQAVANLISKPTGETAAEPEWTPSREEVYLYKPLDPKTKKPVKKATEFEVLSVDLKAKTVDLKSLDNPKNVVKGVPWTSLEEG